MNEDMQPMFSIIIPVYNVAPYLRECLNSVLAQDFLNWEAICVDDGSTDGSGAILDEYAAKDGRFRVIHQRNAGVSAARNAALDAACGEWVWFVDSDDAIHPSGLSFFFGIVQCNPDIETISFTTWQETTQKPFADALPDGKRVIVNSVVTCRGICFHRRGAWGSLVKRSSIGSLRFSGYRIGEDILFMNTVFWTTHLHAYLPAPVYYYRIRHGSAIHSEITCDKIHDFLSTEILLYQNCRHYSTDNDFVEICQFVRQYRNFDWYGLGGQFVHADVDIIKKNLVLWVNLQKTRACFVKDGLYRRFVIFFADVVGSAYLLKLLLLFGRCANRFCGKI